MAAGPKQAAIHVGDRVAVRLDAKSTEESRGEVRYVGPSGAQRAVVGIRLDERKRGLGDGKRSSGERHFRCEPGHAIFASPSQCRLVARAPRRDRRAAGKENEAAPEHPSLLDLGQQALPYSFLQKVVNHAHTFV